MFSVILASIGYAGGVVVDKIELSLCRTPVKKFIPLLFLLLAAITLLLVPSLGHFNSAVFSARYFFLFILMLIVATVWNVFYYEGLQKENLHEFELIMLLTPIVTIILAEIFLPSERGFKDFILGFIASLAFMMSRFRSHHIKLTISAKRTVLAMVLISFESILLKELLSVFSPVMLYFLRTLAIALVFLYLYKPKLKDLPIKSVGMIALSAAFGVLQMVLKFYGFQSLGVVETTMILLLGPFFVYLFSYFYFHERQHYKRDFVCASIVIICVLYSTIVQ